MTDRSPLLRRRATAAVLFATALAAAGPAQADTYPSRPVQVLTTFSAGNIVDLQARAVAEEMRKVLGQQVMVVNKEGAAGLIAFGELARSAPDGHTVLFGPQGMITLQPHLRKEMPFEVAKIDPICQLSENKFAVFVAESSRFKTFADLVAAARKDPGKLNYGNAGIGTIPHVQWFIVEQAIGIRAVPVPYRNFATMPAELMSGQIDFAVTAVGSAGTQQLRALAMLDSRRAGKYPDVPSVKELGYDVPDAHFLNLYAPKGLAPDVHAALGKACAEVARSPSLKETFDRLGVEVIYRYSATIAALLAKDYVVKGAAAKSLNLPME